MAACFLFDNVEVNDPAALARYAEQASGLVAADAREEGAAQAVRNNAVLIDA